jgi:RNA polymerase sigma factor (sigma-70 family)
MTDDPAFDLLMDRLRRGDQEAARQIFQRFAHRLVGLARTRLDSQLRQKIDPEDVMQSAFKSFFHRHGEGQFELDDWDGLWALLTLITLRKCGHKVEHFQAACRNVRREISPATSEEDSSNQWQAIAREPTPDEALLLTEAVEQLFHGLEDGERQILELSLQGYKASEISTQLGRAERSVYRLLERIKRRLENLKTDGEMS